MYIIIIVARTSNFNIENEIIYNKYLKFILPSRFRVTIIDTLLQHTILSSRHYSDVTILFKLINGMILLPTKNTNIIQVGA